MKPFLASLAERAHGVAEVVQPRPRSRFEPDAPGGDDTVEENLQDAEMKIPVMPLPARAEPRLGERVVEIERLLTAAPMTPPVPVVTTATGADRPAETADPPAPDRLSAPVKQPAVEPPPATVSMVKPADMPANRPVIHLHRREAAPDTVSPFATVPAAASAAPQGPPSVTIRIERVDLRAVPPAAPVSRPSATRRLASRPSLEDYLASRR